MFHIHHSFVHISPKAISKPDTSSKIDLNDEVAEICRLMKQWYWLKCCFYGCIHRCKKSLMCLCTRIVCIYNISYLHSCFFCHLKFSPWEKKQFVLVSHRKRQLWLKILFYSHRILICTHCIMSKQKQTPPVARNFLSRKKVDNRNTPPSGEGLV